jgi:hypothetical protein
MFQLETFKAVVSFIIYYGSAETFKAVVSFIIYYGSAETFKAVVRQQPSMLQLSHSKLRTVAVGFRKKTAAYNFEISGPGLAPTQNCGSVKPVSDILTVPS